MTNASATKTPLQHFWEWLLKRGILYALTQTPMIALIVGSFFRWTTYPVATVFTVILAFAILPIWVLVRRNMSDDPDEPVHHLHKYALWALVPYVVYNLSRVPMHYLLDIVFWDHWYDFGAELTGFRVDQWGSLIPGTFIHSLQGYVLALGFYILYKRHNLINALAYVWIFLSVIYTWLFPTYVLVDFQPPPKWFFVVWWAHFWMALAAWYLPRVLYSQDFWGRFKTQGARTMMILIVVLIYIAPVAFVFIRVGTWQFEHQNQIDQDTFNRVQLVVDGAPTLISNEDADQDEAHYQYQLSFGPRPYKDYINATKAVDAGPIQVTGRLRAGDSIIAWCSAYVEMLETPNTITNPLDYFPAVQRLEYTSIPVDCVGPADAAEGLDEVEIEWKAEVNLIGDRTEEMRTFEGAESVEVAAAD